MNPDWSVCHVAVHLDYIETLTHSRYSVHCTAREEIQCMTRKVYKVYSKGGQFSVCQGRSTKCTAREDNSVYDKEGL